ncbi:MAG: AsmA family protein [Draconibacterium sp.]
MKKVFIIIFVVVVLLIGILLALPLVFKPQLLEATKSTINKQIDAKVEFADFKLSLFRNFPKATIGLTEVVVTGKNEFSGDTLFYAPLISAKLNWKSIFSKSEKSIEEIILEQPKINLLVNESEQNNWDVTNSEVEDNSAPAGAAEEENSSFELQLENVEIKNGWFSYTDLSSKMKFRLADINLSVTGKLYNESTLLQTSGSAKDVLLSYDGVDYISNTSLETKTMLEVEFEQMKVLIMQNELLLNRLPLELSGSIEYPADSTFFNLLVKTKESGFENFMAMVPATYSDYFKDVETDGIANITARMKGYYFNDDFPAFVLNMDVRDGSIHFKNMPEKIEKISVDAKVSKPQGDLNLTTITIKKAHAEVKNTPLDLTLKLSDVMSDMQFDGALVGAVNFTDLKDALPLDSANVSGSIDANLFVKGNYSSIEKEEYDKVKVNGIVMLNNFVYDSRHLTRTVLVPQGQMEFSPQNVFLRQLKVKVGQSDFNLSGRVSNYLSYFLKDGTIAGNFQLNSSYVDFNELLRLQKKEKTQVAESGNSNSAESKQAAGNEENKEEKLAVTIPENIDFTIHSKINKAVFDRVPITEVDGLITAKNGKLNLDGLNMNLLEGKMILTGSYENTLQNRPLFNFGFDVAKIDIPTASRTLTSMRNFLPVASQSSGKLSTKMNIKGQLSPDLKIIGRSVNGSGNFSTENVQINNSPVFNQLKGILKSEKLQNVTIDDFKASFTMTDGNIGLKPFKTKVAGQETTVQGTISAENLLDMRLDFNIHRDAFGGDIQNILSVIPGNEKITIVPAGVLISGPVNEPEVKMDLSETRKTVTNATKGELQNSLDKLGKGLKKLFEK